MTSSRPVMCTIQCRQYTDDIITPLSCVQSSAVNILMTSSHRRHLYFILCAGDIGLNYSFLFSFLIIMKDVTPVYSHTIMCSTKT